MTPADSTAFIIFTKAPIPGEVKTRLCPPLTADEAASLHGTLVLDAIERTQGLAGARLYVAGAPDITHPFFKVLAGRFQATLLAQHGSDLGERMHHAFQDVFALGHRSAVLTGVDLPALPRAYLLEALKLIPVHDLVLGPTRDGGYYLIGLRRLMPELFHNIAWSTSSVRADTLAKAQDLGLAVGLLPESRDLDDLDDLHAFIALAGKDGHISKRTGGTLRLIEGRLKERKL